MLRIPWIIFLLLRIINQKNGISRSVVDEKKSHYSSQEKKLIETEWDEEWKKKLRSEERQKKIENFVLSFIGMNNFEELACFLGLTFLWNSSSNPRIANPQIRPKLGSLLFWSVNSQISADKFDLLWIDLSQMRLKHVFSITHWLNF